MESKTFNLVDLFSGKGVILVAAGTAPLIEEMESLETALFPKVFLEDFSNYSGDSAKYFSQYFCHCLSSLHERAPSVGINAAAIKPPCLLDTRCCSFSNGFCDTQRLQAWLCLPRGDSSKFTGVKSAFCSYWMLCFPCKHRGSTLQDSKYLHCCWENKQSRHQRALAQPPWELSGKTWGDQDTESLLWQNLSDCGGKAQIREQLWALWVPQDLFCLGQPAAVLLGPKASTRTVKHSSCSSPHCGHI